jgi:putative Mn2+ efflux pump MntP
MGVAEIFFIAVGLAMDAFAVSIANGMNRQTGGRVKLALATAATFGAFQGAMPAIGYFLGSRAGNFIQRTDHWIALILLSFIGVRMIVGSGTESTAEDGEITVATLFVQGFATSVDALAALSADIVTSGAVISTVTFVISFAGFMLGGRLGRTTGKRADIIGGVLLVAIGLKIFASHILG